MLPNYSPNGNQCYTFNVGGGVPVCFCVGDVPVCGDDTWRDPETAAGDAVDTKVPLYIHIQSPDPRTHVRSAYYRPTCYLDIIQGVLTLKFYSAPEPNLPLQQLQLVPTFPSTPPTTTNISQLHIIIHNFKVLISNQREHLAN